MNHHDDQPRVEPIKVFISYSHDSPEHETRVLGLAQRLRADGLDAQIDQYVPGTPNQGWPRWMLDQIEWAEFVLLVCTETYYRRFRGREAAGRGWGADWEGGLITLEIYQTRSTTTKFVPVLFSADLRFIPDPLRGLTHYVLDNAETYSALVDFLAGQAGAQPGQLGRLIRKSRPSGTLLSFGAAGPEAGIHPPTGDRTAGSEKVRLGGVQIGGIDLTGAQGVVIAPSGPVIQTFGSTPQPRAAGSAVPDVASGSRNVRIDDLLRKKGRIDAATMAEFTDLLTAIGGWLDRTSLDCETRERAQGVLAAVTRLTARPKTRLNVVIAKLERIAKLLGEERAQDADRSKPRQLLQRAIETAPRLFP